MKKLFKLIFPYLIIEYLLIPIQIIKWYKRGFQENSPQIIKEKVFIKYGLKNSIWIETGTFMGTSTKFFCKNYPFVHSVEPSISLYNMAKKRFRNKNVNLYNDISENVLPDLLSSLKGQINFWLDGHYSHGITFKGKEECPIIEELKVIEKYLKNFTAITILIDDVRCFAKRNEDTGYPHLDYLVNWSNKFEFDWFIVHDIFIMKKIIKNF